MKMLPFELDPHCIYCLAIGLCQICASEDVVFHHNEEDELLSTCSSFPLSGSGLRSLYPIWTSLWCFSV